MWYRFIQALGALFNAYSFYKNPKGFILSALSAVAIVFLIYVFGGIILLFVAIAAAVMLYRKAKSSRSGTY